VHADVHLDGPVGTLTSPFLHFPHRSFASIRKTLLGRYSGWEARQKQLEGTRFRWSQLAVRPVGALVTRVILKSGWKDGWRGLLMGSVWSVYVWKSYWKLRLLEREQSTSQRPG
jgi:hypothetical protein